MQVESSSTHFQVAYAAAESREVNERLEVRQSSAAAVSQSHSDEVEDSTSPFDARTLIAAWVYEYFTGERSHLLRLPATSKSTLKAPPRATFGVTYSRQDIHRESESSTFTAQGRVKLKSGQQVSFSLTLALNRDSTEINGVLFRAGNAKDPIALTFDGLGTRLSSDRTEFDLNGDGVNEFIATLASGSAWLAQDQNGNGAVDNGKELFGPATGNGFAELAALDSDHNGWIDSGDAAYSSLGVYQNQTFTSLAGAGIGALAVASIASPFSLKEGSETLGTVRQSGVYLTEAGNAGVLQQVDLTTA